RPAQPGAGREVPEARRGVLRLAERHRGLPPGRCAGLRGVQEAPAERGGRGAPRRHPFRLARPGRRAARAVLLRRFEAGDRAGGRADGGFHPNEHQEGGMSVWKPSATVAAVVERDGRFLFVEERVEGRLVLNQPAGHLDPGESLVAACRREVLEETAHDFEPRSLVGVYRWHYAAKDVTFLRFCFAGDVGASHKDRSLDKEIVALHWLTLDQVRQKEGDHRSPL